LRKKNSVYVKIIAETDARETAVNLERYTEKLNF